MEWDCGNAPSSPNSHPTPSTAVGAVLTFSNFKFCTPIPPTYHLFSFSLFESKCYAISVLPHIFSLCLFSLLLSLLNIFTSSLPWGLPVWYSACVMGQQDGLEHGQAPQTTLIYRTAFQSLLQCCSTYINIPTGREREKQKEKKDVKIIEKDKTNRKGQM